MLLCYCFVAVLVLGCCVIVALLPCCSIFPCEVTTTLPTTLPTTLLTTPPTTTLLATTSLRRLSQLPSSPPPLSRSSSSSPPPQPPLQKPTASMGQHERCNNRYNAAVDDIDKLIDNEPPVDASASAIRNWAKRVDLAVVSTFQGLRFYLALADVAPIAGGIRGRVGGVF